MSLHRSPALDGATDDPGPLHRLTLLWAGLCTGLLALALAAPSWLPWLPPAPWAGLPPLHSRCVAALLAAQALACVLALREDDAANMRIPLALVGVGALASLLALLSPASALPDAPRAPGASAWTWYWALALALVAAATGLLLLGDRELRAPAEHPQPLLLAVALAAGAAAVLLAFHPALAARLWPWPLPPRAAALYAAHFAAWALALAMLSRERRRSARRHALRGLVLLGAGVVAASLRHWPAFHHPAAATAWVLLFAGLALLALQRLRARWPH